MPVNAHKQSQPRRRRRKLWTLRSRLRQVSSSLSRYETTLHPDNHAHHPHHRPQCRSLPCPFADEGTHPSQAMNNTLLSQAQQDKTAISSAAQKLRVAQAESESEKAKVKKLENELVSHRSNFQIIKTIEDLDKVSFSALPSPCSQKPPKAIEDLDSARILFLPCPRFCWLAALSIIQEDFAWRGHHTTAPLCV